MHVLKVIDEWMACVCSGVKKQALVRLYMQTQRQSRCTERWIASLMNCNSFLQCSKTIQTNYR